MIAVSTIAAPGPGMSPYDGAAMAHPHPASRLVLGGHSFASPLANDPLGSPPEQAALVAACLAAGITSIDTTYEDERLALRAALEWLGRPATAQVTIWNFFGPMTDPPPGPAAWTEERFTTALEQMGVDRIAEVVVHFVGDPQTDRTQVDLAKGWKSSGRVGRIGLWWPPEDLQPGTFDFIVRPWNLENESAEPALMTLKSRGFEIRGCSPFVRGWTLDRIAAAAVAEGVPAAGAKGKVADLMLRFSLHQPFVDRLIVAIRRPEWIAANLRSADRGPLSPSERSDLKRWRTAAG